MRVVDVAAVKGIEGTTGFVEFYERELPRLIALSLSMTGRPADAADVAQEALLRSYRSWSAVSKLDRPGMWVRRISINLSIDVRRRDGREHALRARLARQVAPMPTSEPLVDEFWAAVRMLPKRQMTAVALRYVDDLSVEEIAEILGVAEGTVTRSLFEARKALAQHFRVPAEGGVDDR